MKHYRKAIALFLVLALAISLCPAVLAEGEVQETVSEKDAVTEQTQPLTEEELPSEPVEIEPMPDAEEYLSDTENGAEPEENGETVNAADAEKLFPGMPEDYVLPANQLAIKEKLNANNVVSKLMSATPGIDYVDGEVLLLADSMEFALAAAEAYDAQLKSFEYGLAVLTLRNASVIDAVAAGASMTGNLPAVEANYIESIIPVPDDTEADTSFAAGDGLPVKNSWKTWYDSYSDNPAFRDRYLSNPSDFSYQYMHDVVNTYAAWNVSRGAGVTVAVIDSGVNAEHEDLSEKVIGSQSIDPEWEEEGIINSHATHVAGIIAAIEGNGLGGAGIAPDAKIYSVRVFENDTCTTAALLQGMYITIEAKNNGLDSIKVLNMSLGGYGYSYLFEQRVRQAIESGITVVAAMGNEASNAMSYPAAFDIPGLIAVCSTNRSNELSAFSNFGYWADISAPGSSIMSSIKSGYATMSGTSMATPVVAGVCALYLSKYPNATPAQVEAAIKSASNNGIVDASLLFASETSAPEIVPEYAPDAENVLPWNSKLTISSTNASGTLIYTLDGKNPSVKNGKAVGKIYNGSSLTIGINSDLGFVPGKTVQIKAASVNIQGVMGAVSSFSFKVGYAEAESVKIISSVDSVSAGKSFTLKAEVAPAQADQTVYWRITDRQGGGNNTTLDSTRGVLKVGKNETGCVYVQAYVPDESVQSEPIMINVGSAYQVRKIVIDETNISLYTNSYGEGSAPYKLNAHVFSTQYPDVPMEAEHVDWSSSNRKVATVDGEGVVTPVGAGSASITCTSTDGSRITAKCSVKVISIPDEISITGSEYAAPGKGGTYKVNIEPKTATLKNIVWEIDDSSSGVTINRNGKLNVPQNAEAGTEVTVKARISAPVGFEGDLPEDSMTVTIQPLAKGVEIYLADTGFRVSGCTYSVSKGYLKKLQLYSMETQSENNTEKDWHDSYVQLDAYCKSEYDVRTVWSSSNTKVATVNANTGLVKAVAAGTAKITCTTLDSAKKTSSVTVEVINPVSSMTVVSSSPSKLGDYQKLLGFDKYAFNTVAFGETYGKPSIRKVTWDLELFVYRYDYDPETSDLISVEECKDIENEIKANKWVAVDSYGIITTSYALDRYIIPPENHMSYQINATVTAKATDRTNASASMTYTLAALSNGIEIHDYYLKKFDSESEELISREHVTLERMYKTATITVTQGECDEIEVPVYNVTYGAKDEYSILSSKPEVAGALSSGGTVYIYPGQVKGSTRITATTTDGSKKTISITVIVK